MRAFYRVPLILAAIALPACLAGAQNLPWPGEAPRPAAAPWPGGGTSAAPPMQPMAMPMPGVAAPMSPGAASFGGGGGAGMPPCLTEFTKLREEVQKRGLAAKAAGERKVSREEMCKEVTAYSAVELKWVKFTEANVSKCGIPAEVPAQLKQAHARTEETKQRICAVGPAAGVPAPSLAEALGTTKLPSPEKTKTAKGTLDTLTGNALQR